MLIRLYYRRLGSKIYFLHNIAYIICLLVCTFANENLMKIGIFENNSLFPLWMRLGYFLYSWYSKTSSYCV